MITFKGMEVWKLRMLNKRKKSIFTRFQFTRNGYYVPDFSSTPENLVFNRIVSLRSSYKPKAK